MLYSLQQYFAFYYLAKTRYQLHSPFVYDLVTAVLHDDRWYYAFRDIESLRANLLQNDAIIETIDYGALGNAEGLAKTRALSDITRRSSSSPAQGRMLFRLVQHLQPKTILEMGSSVGIGTCYLASGRQQAQLISLEGSPALSAVARNQAEWLRLKNVQLISGPFRQTLPDALHKLQKLDLVFVDGHHAEEPTREYLETIMPYTHDRTTFVFDDIYWSKGMTNAWRQFLEKDEIRLSIDFFDLSIACRNPDFPVAQHFRVLKPWQKPWKIW